MNYIYKAASMMLSFIRECIKTKIQLPIDLISADKGYVWLDCGALFVTNAKSTCW